MDNGTEISSGISQEPPETFNELLRWILIWVLGVLSDHPLKILLYLIIASAVITFLWRMWSLVTKQPREMHRLDPEIPSQNPSAHSRRTKHSSHLPDNFSRREVREPTKSSFIWRIPNFAKELGAAWRGERNVILSEPFFTSRNGYKLQGHLYLCGHLDVTDRHLSVFVEVLPGKFDSSLRWSIVMKGSLTLMDQAEDPYEAIHITYPNEPNMWPCDRPLKGSRSCAMEFSRFVSHEDLCTRHYMKDDTIVIKIEIEEIEKSPFDYE